MMRRAWCIIAAAIPIMAGSAGAQGSGDVSPDPPLGVTGIVRFHGGFASGRVAARNVEVWLPPGYEDSDARYPVLYLHDGQNAFAPATAYGGVDWALDETMTRLIRDRAVRPAIVVAVWNTSARAREYMPAKAVGARDSIASGIGGVPPLDGAPLSDAYLAFLVDELKPFIDRTYRTLPGPGDTFIMGSSMGGLISLYAWTEYPHVFGGAAALSTHWPAGNGAVVDYLARALPPPGERRIYFDHGTATLDSLYAPFQARVDAVLRSAGYTEGRDWITRVFEGAEHSERAWRTRAAIPLRFLLGTRPR